MVLIETIIVAFSMFSVIPMPHIMWDEKNMKYSLCAFPLIGFVIGACMWGVYYLSDMLLLPEMVTGALFTIIPMLITGGIHMDGFADTSDALASHMDRDRKLEILKDPHIGSFAVIKICMYFVVYYALWCSVVQYDVYNAAVIMLSYVLSRCLSGTAVTAFPMAKNTGLAHTFANASVKGKARIVLIIETVIVIAVMCVLSPIGIAMSIAAIVVFIIYRVMSSVQFGGITGDLAGWFLSVCELMMLAAYLISVIYLV